MKKRSPGDFGDHLYTTGELERLLGVPDSTLVDWERKGFLAPSLRVGRHRRYAREDLKRILQVRTLTQRYRFREQVLEALSRGEAANAKPPSDYRERDPHQQASEFSREWLLDLAARNAELLGEQRRLAKQLAMAEQRYRDLVETSADIIATVDKAGTLTYINPAIRHYGYEPAEMVGQTTAALRARGLWSLEFPPGSLYDQRITLCEIAVVSPKGATSLLEVKLIPRYENGHIVESHAVGRDTTERRKIEEALRESDRKFRKLFHSANDAIYLSQMYDEGLSCQLIEVNDTACRRLGYSREELLTMSHSDVCAPEDRPSLAATLAKLESEGKSTVEVAEMTKSGDRIPVEVSAHLLVLNGKRVVLSIAMDIGERVRAEEQRKQHLAGLNHLISLSFVAVAETTVAGLLQKVVDAARELTGARIGVCGHGYVGGSFLVGAISHAEDVSPCLPGESFRVEMGGVYLDLAFQRPSIRLAQCELEQHQAWWGFPEQHRPLRGLLGARLVDREGNAQGLLMVSDKEGREFTSEDEALLTQMAATASLALQHIEARAHAEKREREMEAVFASVSDSLVVFDAQGEPARWNPAAATAYGYPDKGNTLAELACKGHICRPDGSLVPMEDLW